MTSADTAWRPAPSPARSAAALMEVPLSAIAIPVALLNHRGAVLAVTPAFAQLFGVDTDAAIGHPVQSLFATPLEDAWVPGPVAHAEGRSVIARRVGGGEFPVAVSWAHTRQGDEARVVLSVRDESAAAELERALAENRDLAEQLRRSQKIGALGRLAGGVAHDFNNLLQVIGGLAESLAAERLSHPSRRRLARQICRTSDRAASLTRQLLAFGRRQVLVPEVLDLNETVQSLERMLRRVIGEDVQLAATLAPDVQPVLVDPGQIEQVVLNLALNARDAMRDGGTLEIATANFSPRVPWEHPALPVRVPPGAWVRLTVRDTGCGMDEATAAQAYEPFFTTKDASTGSGLGLSMVYGIVKQSGGYTWIETAPSSGTLVHVLLPAVEAAREPRGRVLAPQTATPPSSGATLLLAEDDEEVRALFSTILRRGGYAVHEAADGEAALAVFEAHAEDIDVVVTDVVMPSVSGPALASAIRARRPDVKVLYVSGYTEQLDLGLQSEHGTALLQKPVSRTVLLKQIAALLADAPPTAH